MAAVLPCSYPNQAVPGGDSDGIAGRPLPATAERRARGTVSVLVFALLAGFVGHHAHAATATWKSGTGYWTDLDAWVQGFEPTLVDDVYFDSLQNGLGGRVRLHQTAADIKIRSVRGMTFLLGVGSYIVENQTGTTQKDLLIGEGGIVNDSASLQTFDTRILIAEPQTWSANAGDIAALGVVQLTTNMLTLEGVQDITVSGAISGTGSLTKDGPGTLTLAAPNTYTGTTFLNAGTLTYRSPQSSAGTFALHGGVLNANDQSLTFLSLSLLGDITLRLGTDTTNQMVRFSEGSWTAGVLSIENWNPGATSDQLFFTNAPPASFLSQVQFAGYPQGSIWLRYELVGGVVVPIPEPSGVVLAGVGLLVLILLGRLRRGGRR